MKDLKRFIEKVYGLSHVVRWNFNPTLRKENVAEHSFYVALFTMILSQDMEAHKDLVLAALLHDTEESITADLPALVKRYISTSWNEVVSRAEAELIGGGDDKFFDEFVRLRHVAEHSSVVKMADLFSALMYAREELTKGNNYFGRIERELIQSIVDAARKCEFESVGRRAVLLLESLGFDHAFGLPRPTEISHL